MTVICTFLVIGFQYFHNLVILYFNLNFRDSVILYFIITFCKSAFPFFLSGPPQFVGYMQRMKINVNCF